MLLLYHLKFVFCELAYCCFSFPDITTLLVLSCQDRFHSQLEMTIIIATGSVFVCSKHFVLTKVRSHGFFLKDKAFLDCQLGTTWTTMNTIAETQCFVFIHMFLRNTLLTQPCTECKCLYTLICCV